MPENPAFGHHSVARHVSNTPATDADMAFIDPKPAPSDHSRTAHCRILEVSGIETVNWAR